MSGFGERLQQRQKGFKKAVDGDDARRKREDAAVQLRKQSKEEALLKKRMVTCDEDGTGADCQANDSDLVQGDDVLARQVADIPDLLKALNSDNAEAVFQATHQFRKMLSVETSPPTPQVIEAGAVPRFVQLLGASNHNLQFEAAWVLTNIASGTAEQTRVVVEHGALPRFVEMLRSPSEDVREQAVWALGNIAGDCALFRDMVLQSGGLPAVLALLGMETEKMSFLRNATWTLSNLCRGKPAPPLDWVAPALPSLKALICQADQEVITDATWALSYLTDGTSDRVEAVVRAGVGPRLVELLGCQCHNIQIPVLRTVGNIVTGSDHQTQAMLDAGVLPQFLLLLQHEKKSIRKECCWAVSNITAGTAEQIQAVISAGLIVPIVRLLAIDEFDVKKEAAWAISNATAASRPEQMEVLVTSGCLKPLCDLLQHTDTDILDLALDTLINVLNFGRQQQAERGIPENPIVDLIDGAGGTSKIEELQQHEKHEVAKKAGEMLDRFFPLEEANDAGFLDAGTDQGLADFGTAIPQGGFNFGPVS